MAYLDEFDCAELTAKAKALNPRLKRWISEVGTKEVRRFRCNLCGSIIAEESVEGPVNPKTRVRVNSHRDAHLEPTESATESAPVVEPERVLLEVSWEWTDLYNHPALPYILPVIVIICWAVAAGLSAALVASSSVLLSGLAVNSYRLAQVRERAACDEQVIETLRTKLDRLIDEINNIQA